MKYLVVKMIATMKRKLVSLMFLPKLKNNDIFDEKTVIYPQHYLETSLPPSFRRSQESLSQYKNTKNYNSFGTVSVSVT